MYRVIQTGAKIQLGGEKAGLFKVTYQVGIEETVKNEPIIPAPKQSPMDTNNFGKSLGINLTVPFFPKSPHLQKL